MLDYTLKDWEGLEGFSEELLAEIKPDLERAVLEAQLFLEGIVKRTLTGQRTGRRYKVSRTGRIHVASAPGEAPAVLFGNLRNSVGHSDPEWDEWVVSGRVGPGLGQAPTDGSPDPGRSYARRLEYGGTDSRGVHIEPRPYMEPSVVKAEPWMNRIFETWTGSHR